MIRTFENAAHGDKMVYHTGCLASDRSIAGKGGERKAKAQDVGTVAGYFALMAKRNVALLVQKRIEPIKNLNGPYIHEYIAIKR